MIFLFAFQSSMSSMPWTLCSEIFPTHLRGVSNALTTTANFTFNYLVSALFLTATSTSTGKVTAYLLIAGFCLAAWIFIYKWVPETKGKSLRECTELFMSSFYINEI